MSLSKQQLVARKKPPYLTHVMACRSWQVNDRNVLWLRPGSAADALWAAEQILKNRSCGDVILRQSNVRAKALRQLNLGAQSTDTWLWLIRPLVAAADASPSPQRIALWPALGGVSVNIINRRDGLPLSSPIDAMDVGLSVTLVRGAGVSILLFRVLVGTFQIEFKGLKLKR